MIENILNRKLLFVIIAAALLRVAFILITVDLYNTETWEYGAIAENIYNGKGFSFFYEQDNSILYKYSQASKPFISAYMPPGYPFLIVPFYSIENITVRNGLILLLNIFADIFSVLLIYLLIKNKINEYTALIAAFIFACLPEIIFLASKVGTGSLYICLSLFLFYLLEKTNHNKIQLIQIGTLLSFMVYLRSETILLLILISFYLMYKKQIKSGIIITGIVITALMPWQIRNYTAFDTFVPLTTSSGLNLYRGNNPEYPGSWGEEKMSLKKANLPNNYSFEIKMNKFYTEEAVNFILNNKIKSVGFIFQKLFNLYFIDWHDKRACHPLYLISHFTLLLLFILGLIKYFRNNKKFDSLLIFIVFYSITCAVFFALPRYQTMMKPAMIPFAAYFIALIYKKQPGE